jgi:hypothetical protein
MKCSHCHQRTGRPDRRCLCDTCYASPARGLYDGHGRRVAEFPPAARDADAEDGRRPPGRYSRGRGTWQKRV